MNFKSELKDLVSRVPYSIGHYLAKIPFSVRLGRGYELASEQQRLSELWNDADKEAYAVACFKVAFERAKQFRCYREYYRDAGVLDFEIRTLADIKCIPVINKEWVRKHAHEFSGAYSVNTGGSSGEPMSFFVDKDAWAREWAHMHSIWAMLGYKYTDVKLTLRGRSHSKRALAYNPVHNEFVVSPYLPVEKFKQELIKICKKRKPKWIHGYPSVIYQFILELESCLTAEESKIVLGGIKGLMLSSEFPMPYMVRKFKEYDLQMVSWYGHSEMCVLAHSLDCKNQYKTFVTYGLAENEDGHLIGTSYHNTDMPLVRYDTGDMIETLDSSEGGLLKTFAIKEGRNSDFILDRNGKPFSLNSLMIGRHHHAFDVADYVQVEQVEKGKATFLVCSKQDLNEPMERLFDIPKVDVEFSMRRIDTPIRTKAGKLRLHVGSIEDLNNRKD